VASDYVTLHYEERKTDKGRDSMQEEIRRKWHELIRGNERLRSARERALRKTVLRKLQAANRALKAIGAEEVTLGDSVEMKTMHEEVEQLRFALQMPEDASGLKVQKNPPPGRS
jgi:hypothetical protein